MATPQDRYFVGQAVKPIVKEIDTDKQQYKSDYVVFYFPDRILIQPGVAYKGYGFKKYAAYLRADTAAKVGYGIVHAVVAKAAHTGYQQLYAYQQKENRNGIYYQAHERVLMGKSSEY
jgi:uncharacterized protein YegL